MNIVQISPWTEGCVRLAQCHTIIGLKLHFDGTMYAYITDWCAPHEIDQKEDFVPVEVTRGYLWWKGVVWTASTRYSESDAFLAQTAVGLPVDGVPWEIHSIDDPIAYAAARQAFIDACRDPLA